MKIKVILEDHLSKYRSVLMGIAMLSIMLSHQRFVHVFPFNVFESYGHWGVDVFLFLSGMGMVRSLMTYSTKFFYCRRFKRLIPLCVLCGTIKYVVFLLGGNTLKNLEIGLNLGIWSIFSLDLWFIHSIIIYYLLSPLLYRVIKFCPHFFFYFVFIMSFVLHFKYAEEIGYDWLNPLGIALYTIDRLPVFLIGMIIAMYKERLNNDYFIGSAVFLFVTICLTIILKTCFSSSYLQAFVYPLLSLGILSVIMGQILLFERVSDIFLIPLNFIGKHSLEIYLVHEFIFGAFLLKLFTSCNHNLLLLLSFALSVIVAWCSRWCVERMSFGSHSLSM